MGGRREKREILNKPLKAQKLPSLVKFHEEIIQYQDGSYPRSGGVIWRVYAEAYHDLISNDRKAKALYYKVHYANSCVELRDEE